MGAGIGIGAFVCACIVASAERTSSIKAMSPLEVRQVSAFAKLAKHCRVAGWDPQKRICLCEPVAIGKHGFQVRANEEFCFALQWQGLERRVVERRHDGDGRWCPTLRADAASSEPLERHGGSPLAA